MKSLPKLTCFCLAALAMAWIGDLSRELTTGAHADDAAQTKDSPSDPVGSAATPDTSAQSAAALTLLQEARQALFVDRSSVQAVVRETVNMGPRKFRGEGTYIAGQFPKLRLSLSLNVGGTSGKLTEVCDGTILWTVQEIDIAGQSPDIQVARTVISDVTQASLESHTDIAETSLIAGLGVGGLPALLAALERSMTFEALREIEEEGRAFSVIQGRWSDEYLQRVTGGADDTQLPPYMPDHVRIYFDKATKFPTRILYLRRTEPGSRTFSALLSLEFADVILDAPVSEEQFQYSPPSTVKVRDRTAEFLKMIRDAASENQGAATVRPDGSVPLGTK